MEDQFLDTYWESQYDYDYFHGDDEPHYYERDDYDDRDPSDVDDDFPMYLEYEGPFGLSGYDEY